MNIGSFLVLCSQMHVCSKPVLSSQRQKWFFRDKLKNLKIFLLSASSSNSTGAFSKNNFSVKHPFPLSHLRALLFLLLNSMAIHSCHLKFTFDYSSAWKQQWLNSRCKLSELTGFSLMQPTVANQAAHLLCFCLKK